MFYGGNLLTIFLVAINENHFLNKLKTLLLVIYGKSKMLQMFTSRAKNYIFIKSLNKNNQINY